MRSVTFKFIVLFTSVILMSGCKNFKGYKIEGEIKNAGQTKVYLEDISSNTPAVIDTAIMDKGVFKMKNYAAKGIYRLRFGENMNNAIFLFLNENDDILIKADLKDLKEYTVEGSKASVSIQQLILVSQNQLEALDSAYSKLRYAPADSKDSLQVVFEKQKTEYVQFIKNTVDQTENNDVACFALNFLGPMMQDEIPYLIEITDKLHKSEPDSRYITNWYNSLQQYREALLEQNQGGMAINTEAPDILLATPKGDTIQLSSLRGKYVLVDFWASWCQPCRMENPNVVAAYKRFHPKGFEVFSVSLDANRDQWLKAIAKDGLVWKYHGCDFGGWQSAAAQTYGVNSIPSAFLLDKSGNIIAKNLRGEELIQKLAELYANETVN